MGLQCLDVIFPANGATERSQNALNYIQRHSYVIDQLPYDLSRKAVSVCWDGQCAYCTSCWQKLRFFCEVQAPLPALQNAMSKRMGVFVRFTEHRIGRNFLRILLVDLSSP
jgi:hypothetical protein